MCVLRSYLEAAFVNVAIGLAQSTIAVEGAVDKVTLVLRAASKDIGAAAMHATGFDGPKVLVARCELVLVQLAVLVLDRGCGHIGGAAR